MIPNPKYCRKDCICWRCKHKVKGYCCAEIPHHNLDRPEDKLGQHCPDFTPIRVQSTGLDK